MSIYLKKLVHYTSSERPALACRFAVKWMGLRIEDFLDVGKIPFLGTTKRWSSNLEVVVGFGGGWGFQSLDFFDSEMWGQ